MKYQTTTSSQKTATFKEVACVGKEAIDTNIMDRHASLAIINKDGFSYFIKYLNLEDT